MSVGLTNLDTDGRSFTTGLRAGSADQVSPIPPMLQGPRSMEVKGSAEREVSVSSVGSNSIATLLKDSTSVSKRLEAMEQQMLATHMRAAAASEAAEVVAHNMVAPFSDEISALKARVEMTEQQIQSCAPASHIERLSDRILEAEVRITNGSTTTEGPVNTEHAVALARLEERMSVISRQMHDTAVKVEDIEHGRIDPERIERCVNSVESIAAMVQEQQVRQSADSETINIRLREQQIQQAAANEAINSRLEALEQQLTLVQREVVDIQIPKVAAPDSTVADLVDRISAVENSYQEMGGAILRHQETIRPLIENEIAGLVIRLDAQEKLIQSNAAQAIGRAQTIEENEREKDSYREEISNRMAGVEERLKALASLSQQTSTLSARISMAEKQLAAAPSASEMKKLQSELQASLNPDADGGSGATKANENSAQGSAVSDLRQVVDGVRQDVSRLSTETNRLTEGLQEERQERFLALADVNRLSEVVAKAAASTIERAELRFAEELGAEREKLRQELNAAKEISLSFVSTASVKDSGCQDTASVSSAGEMHNRQSLLKSVKGSSLGIGSDLARCIGEMDAELRMELTGCLEEVHKDIETLRQELSARIGAVESRLQERQNSGTVSADVKGNDELAHISRVRALVKALDDSASSGAQLSDLQNIAEELSLYKAIAAEQPRVNLRPHSRRLAQEGKAESVSSVTSAPGSTSGDVMRNTSPAPSVRDTSSPPNRHRSEVLQRSANAPAVNAPAGTPMLSEMFQAAMKQMMPAAMAQQVTADEKQRSASPVRQPEISEDLKANLRNLVSAVNRTLGDEETTTTKGPERNSSVPFRTDLRSNMRSTSPQHRQQSQPGQHSQSVPPNMNDTVGTGSTSSLLGGAGGAGGGGQTPVMQHMGGSIREAIPMNRGRSPDASGPPGSSPVNANWPDRSGSPAAQTPTFTGRGSLPGTSTPSLSAASGVASGTGRTTPAGSSVTAKSAKPQDPASMTWPGSGAFARPLNQERIVPGAAQQQRPSVGQAPLSQTPMGQMQSPRSRPPSQVAQSTPADSRGLSRSSDATSVPRMPQGARFVSQAPAAQATQVNKGNLRGGWKRHV